MAVAGRVYDRLQTEFGKGKVFMDFDSIPYGIDFREHIKQSLANAEALLVLIGPQWFGNSEKAATRIDEPDDFVRLEIAEALKREVPVIPVLINNTRMPAADALPPEIQPLSFRNGLALDSGIDFHPHVNRLVTAIKKLIKPRSRFGTTRFKRALQIALCVTLLAGAGGWYFVTRERHDKPKQQANEAKAVPLAERQEATNKLAVGTFANATKEQPWENSLGMKFVPVPIRGGPTSGQPVLFSIWLTRVKDFAQFVEESGYDMSKGEAAYTLESDVKGGWTWKQAGGSWTDPHFPPEASQTEEHPVVCVSWEDALAFCKWLTGREHQTGRLPAEWTYRLPSDHEWSCAVRIGEKEDASETPKAKNGKLDGIYPWGREWPPPNGAGNYAGEESRIGVTRNNWSVIEGYRDGWARTSPVGSYVANELGLYDMGGNVWEWCQDKYTPAQTSRVLRGASWDNGGVDPDVFLASSRRYSTPAYRYGSHGFRVLVTRSAR